MRLPKVKRFICLTDDARIPARLERDAEYEELLAHGDPTRQFAELDENTRAPRFTTPLARLAHRKVCTSAIASWCCIA